MSPGPEKQCESRIERRAGGEARCPNRAMAVLMMATGDRHLCAYHVDQWDKFRILKIWRP